MTRNSQAVTGPGSLNLSSQNDLHFQFLVPSHRLLQGSCGDQILVVQRERLAPLALSGSLQRVPRAVPTKRTMRPLRASAAPPGRVCKLLMYMRRDPALLGNFSTWERKPPRLMAWLPRSEKVLEFGLSSERKLNVNPLSYFPHCGSFVWATTFLPSYQQIGTV